MKPVVKDDKCDERGCDKCTHSKESLLHFLKKCSSIKKSIKGDMHMRAIYWLVIFVVLLLIEIFTMGLTTIWFAVGSLCSFGAALLGFGIPTQIGIFFVVSIVLLIATRPIAMKHFNKAREKTNVESLIGQTAKVMEDIDETHGVGRVIVNGQEWAAKADTKEECLQKGDIVSIMGIQGVKLIVTKKGGLN